MAKLTLSNQAVSILECYRGFAQTYLKVCERHLIVHMEQSTLNILGAGKPALKKINVNNITNIS